jgi:uncharacterized membrane protein YjfL (UPF0719 family)
MILLYVALVFCFLFLSKKISDALTRFDDDAAVEKENNRAVALRRFGLYTGISIALAGVMTDDVSGIEVLIFLLDGAIATVIFFIAHFINDYAIVPHVRNNELIKAGNVSTGILEAGSFIATGILLNGVFSGTDGGTFYSIVFFFLGQMLLIFAVLVHQKLYRFNVTKCMVEGNMSAGITVAGLLIAYSLILRSSVSGEFTGWAESIGWFGISAITGMAALIIFEKAADWLFLPKTKIADDLCADNTAAVIIVQAIVISLGLIISQLV